MNYQEKKLLHDFYYCIVNINHLVSLNRKLDSTNYYSPQSPDCLQYRGDHLYLLLISIPIEFFLSILWIKQVFVLETSLLLDKFQNMQN
jgi:hypothetical protein